MSIIINGSTTLAAPTLVGPVQPLLLDTYTGAAAAYSLRKLRTAYTGAAIRVRRLSDSAEQDIGFDANNDLNTSALLSFIGISSGFITTWYDQSGNNRNATQTTGSNQPAIISSGSILTINNKVGVNFYNGSQRLSSYKFAAPSSDWVLLYVGSVNNNSGINNNISGTDGNGFNANGYYNSMNAHVFNRTSSNASITAGITPSSNTLYLSGIEYFSTNNAIAHNNNSASASTSMLISGNPYTTGDQSVYWMGAYRSSGTFNASISLIGYILEHIVYQSNQNSNISGIKSNINQYYNIY